MDRDQGLKKLIEITRDIDFCMMVTLDSEGRPHARPMSTQEITADGVAWFLTSRDSHKTAEIRDEPVVNLSYAANQTSRYVSVTGRAELVDDREKIHELWSVWHKAWWPDGKDDPDIIAMKVTVEQAEYWDAPGGRLVQLFSFAKALATHRPIEMDEDAHGTVGH